MARATSALGMEYDSRRVRGLAVLLLWVLPSTAFAGDVVVLSFGGTAEDADGGAWLPARLPDLIGERLTRLGVAARDRRFETKDRAAAIVGGKIDPKNPID